MDGIFWGGVAFTVVGVLMFWRGAIGSAATLLTGLILLVVFILLSCCEMAFARDPDGRYAQSPLKSWFDGLRSGKGPCCSDADGSVVIDGDWESRNGHFRVKVDGEWIDVPDDAVLTEPNRDGRTIVWPLRGYMGTTIRCFIPGTMG